MEGGREKNFNTGITRRVPTDQSTNQTSRDDSSISSSSKEQTDNNMQSNISGRAPSPPSQINILRYLSI